MNSLIDTIIYVSNLRGHNLKLQRSYSRTDIRNDFFTNWIIDSWNKLPEEVVTTLTASLSILK